MIDIFEFSTKHDFLKNVPPYIEELFDIATDKVEKQVDMILNKLIDGIVFIVEYPYVEKYYRDTYYSFFSKKHRSHERDSVRISFFKNGFKINDFDDPDKKELIQSYYLGFITLRPTSYRIIGHSFLSPTILKENSFVSCLCKKKVLISGCELEIFGFPFCSQDNESITCAESVLINLLDYFSCKFPEYQQLMPSRIHEILRSNSYERQLPTTGVSWVNMSFVLKELGFGTKLYSKDAYDEDVFKSIMFTYLESAIPVIVNLVNPLNKTYHSVLAIGREAITGLKELPDAKVGYGKVKYSMFFDKILVMDDNHTPFELVSYKEPALGMEINSIIVPLYSKVHSEAFMFMNYLEKVVEELSKNEKVAKVFPKDILDGNIARYFLTTSRSYKNYLNNSGAAADLKRLLIDKSMPKLIWVSEIIYGEKLNKDQPIKIGIIIDATESGDSSSLIAAFGETHLFLKNVNISQFTNENEKEYDLAAENKYSIIEIKNNNGFLYTFANNLKGEHTKWQN